MPINLHPAVESLGQFLDATLLATLQHLRALRVPRDVAYLLGAEGLAGVKFLLINLVDDSLQVTLFTCLLLLDFRNRIQFLLFKILRLQEITVKILVEEVLELVTNVNNTVLRLPIELLEDLVDDTRVQLKLGPFQEGYARPYSRIFGGKGHLKREEFTVIWRLLGTAEGYLPYVLL